MGGASERRPGRPDLTRRRWREIEAILDAALALPIADRPGFVRDAGRDDPDLRRRVESLLARYPALDEFLAAPTPGGTGAGSELDLDAASFEGRRVDPYRIVGELARGGRAGSSWRSARMVGSSDASP